MTTTYLVNGLLEFLLERAEDTAPGGMTVRLGVVPAEELDLETALPGDTPVFAAFYHPEAADSVEAVFGVDMSVPPGRAPGVFVSHPDGTLSPRSSDDYAERILVAVPPWTADATAMFDRRGRRLELEVVTTASTDGGV